MAHKGGGKVFPYVVAQLGVHELESPIQQKKNCKMLGKFIMYRKGFHFHFSQGQCGSSEIRNERYDWLIDANGARLMGNGWSN